MKRKIILSFIMTAIILFSCSLGVKKVSSSKNSNVASGTVISDNKENLKNFKKVVDKYVSSVVKYYPLPRKRPKLKST